MSSPIRLTPRGWRFVAAAFAIWLSWFFIGLRDIWALIALLVALLLVALVWVLVIPALARLEVHVSSSNPTPTVGESVRLTATIRNRAAFAIRCSATWNTDGRRRAASLRIESRDTAVSEMEWEAVRRGPSVARVRELLITDPFGFAVRRVDVDARLEMLVLPRQLEGFALELRRVGRIASVGGLSGNSTVGGDSGERAGTVREYRTGDPLRLIHWKQSARQGELLVNLRESAGVSERTLMLVVARDSHRSEREFELAVSASVTLASRWIDEGHQLRLVLDAAQPVICVTEVDMLRALAYARLVPSSAAPDASELVPTPQVVVTGRLNQRLADELDRSDGQGLLVASWVPEDVAPPRNWRVFEIPAAELRGEAQEQGSTPTAAPSAVRAGSGRR